MLEYFIEAASASQAKAHNEVREELTEVVERLRIQHNDDENIEAKKCETKLSNDVWESVSAFGNTSGGLILLGLDQENGFTIPPKFDIDKSIEQFDLRHATERRQAD